MSNPGTLIVSISGIRGIFGDGLDARSIVRYAEAFGIWCRQQAGGRATVVVGRDARVTGEVCAALVTATLQSVGCDVIDAGLAPTPTIAYGVLAENAAGGVILSASHNPAEWNALKLLGQRGEFLRAVEAEAMLALADAPGSPTVRYDAIGSLRRHDYLGDHIDAILALPYIQPDAIAKRRFRVVVDGINSVGAVAMPAMLRRLGVAEADIVVINGEPNGRFAHNPEPLPGHLADLMHRVASEKADLGIAVDPDADRLALVADGGVYMSEELTQVIAADFLWKHAEGPFVTNLSSSRAIEDIARRHGQRVYRSAVGEINVVDTMQAVGAVLGGEGNGGVIVPELHYGRDALVGVAMVLQHLADEGLSMSALRERLPRYAIVKDRLPLGNSNPDDVLAKLAERHKNDRISTVDGLKIDFEDGWVHLRKSNTEPIVRIYAEAATEAEAQAIADRFKRAMGELA
ncbi:MAG: phosphoglucosamine mutase [Rhodothermales bacterium]